MLYYKLLRVVQAHLSGFSTGNMSPWKRFCLFCLFYTFLSIIGCLVQLVYTKFPGRVFPTPRNFRAAWAVDFTAQALLL